MEKKKNEALYVNRHKSLKAHKAAVAARKALKGGKNVGPVANAAAYGETIKKPKPAAKPAAKPKAKPTAKPKATPKPAAKPAAKRPAQTTNGASLGSKLTAAERAKRKAAMSPESVSKAETKKKPAAKAYRSGRNALAARNAEKNKTRSYKDPRSETRTRYVRTAGGGKKAVPEIKVNGKWVKAGGKG